MNTENPILSVDNLCVWFDVKPQGAMPWTKPNEVKAVDGVGFELMPGEALGYHWGKWVWEIHTCLRNYAHGPP